MLQREYRQSSTARNSNNAYVLAMKALQDKIKVMENERSLPLQQSVELLRSPETEQLKAQNSLLQRDVEKLQQMLSRFSNNQENVSDYTLQIEALQNERLQHLKDYQDRVSDLIRKNEDLKKEKQEMHVQYESLQRQLQAYKSNEKGFQHKAELIKYEETAKLNELVSELRQRLDQNDFYVKKMEKKYEKLQNEKHLADNELIDYKEKCPLYKFQEQEKQLHQLRYQLEEKERVHIKMMEDQQSSRSLREEQLSRKVQDLLNKNNELQSTIHQQTIDYKDLNLKYQQLKMKLDYDDKNSRMIQQRKISQQEDIEHNDPKGFNKLNLDLISPQITSPRYNEQSVKQSMLKQAIKDCIEDMKHTTPFQSSQSQQQQQLQQFSSKKKILSPPLTTRNFDQEVKMKQLNDRYELLIRQAQKEPDFKQKAIIRKELLDIAEQIKDLNRQK